jgi:hypothetical protein
MKIPDDIALNGDSKVLRVLTGWFRSVKYGHWLLLLTLLIGMCGAFVPFSVWDKLLSAIRCSKTLVGLMLLFALLSVSLIWVKGQSIDAGLFRFINSSPHNN